MLRGRLNKATAPLGARNHCVLAWNAWTRSYNELSTILSVYCKLYTLKVRLAVPRRLSRPRACVYCDSTVGGVTKISESAVFRSRPVD